MIWGARNIPFGRFNNSTQISDGFGIVPFCLCRTMRIWFDMPSRRPDLRPLAQSAPCSQDLRSLAAARPGWVLAVVLAGLAVPRLCAWLRQGGLCPEFPVLDPWLHSLMATAAGRAQRPGSWVKLICMLTGNPRGPTGPGWPSCAVISQDTPIAPRQPPLI